MKSLERFTAFPETEGFITPVRLYEAIYPTIPIPRDEIYFSSPLTSGGAVKLFNAETIADNIPTIVRLNSEFAETLASEGLNQLTAERLTLPHRIGKKQGWKELEYLEEWIFYLSGVDPLHAASFDHDVQAGGVVNAATLNNHALPKEVRRVEYNKLVDKFFDSLSATDVLINPVSGIINIPDHQLPSLGRSAEGRLAAKLNIPILNVLFDTTNPRFEDLIRLAPWLTDLDISIAEKGLGNSAVIFQQQKDYEL